MQVIIQSCELADSPCGGCRHMLENKIVYSLVTKLSFPELCCPLLRATIQLAVGDLTFIVGCVQWNAGAHNTHTCTTTHTRTPGLSRYRTGEASETSHSCFTNRMRQSASGHSLCVIVHLFVSGSFTVSLCACLMCIFMQLYSFTQLACHI